MKQYILPLLAILHNCDTRSSAILRQSLETLPNPASKAAAMLATKPIRNASLPRIAKDYWEYLRTEKGTFLNLITHETKINGYASLGLTPQEIDTIEKWILIHFMDGRSTSEGSQNSTIATTPTPTTVPTTMTMSTSAAIQTPAASQVKEIKYTFDRNFIFAHQQLPKFIEQYYQNITFQVLEEMVYHEDYNFLGPKECRVSVANFFLQEWHRRHYQPPTYWYIPKNKVPSENFLEKIRGIIKLTLSELSFESKNIGDIIKNQGNMSVDKNFQIIDKNIEYIIVPASDIKNQEVNNTLDKLLHETAGNPNLKIIIAFNDRIEHIPDNFNINKNITHAIITGYNVFLIGNFFIGGHEKLTTLTLPEGLIFIENDCLIECTRLTTLKLPYGLISIDKGFLFKSTGVKSITFPDGLRIIGDDCLARCTELTTLTLSNSLNSAPRNFLFGCSSVTTLQLPFNLTLVQDNFLAGCTGLTTLTLPAELIFIGKNFLHGCTGLQKIVLSQKTLDAILEENYDFKKRFKDKIKITD
ncbi:leucine-rich repeat domain-containing protein [Candidatus Dependentiae bacterium]|nr:leucine-rich repeat domain-containing protein [Candidatus Dependentiae bacterium]